MKNLSKGIHKMSIEMIIRAVGIVVTSVSTIVRVVDIWQRVKTQASKKQPPSQR